MTGAVSITPGGIAAVPLPTRVVFGFDVGQTNDTSAGAIVIVRPPEGIETAVTMHDLDVARARHDPPRLDCVHLERLPLGTPYPAQVQYVSELLTRPPLAGATVELAIDYGGVGAPVFDMFKQCGVRPLGIVITGGDREIRGANNTLHVAKLLLVSRLQALLHTGGLKIAKGLPDAAELARELQDFRATISQAGHAQFSARNGAHDDLTLALCIAVWVATRQPPTVACESVPM